MKKIVKVKDVIIGGDKIVIQSMTNTKTGDTVATIKQILQLQNAGCDLIRLSINDTTALKALKIILAETHSPLIGDIHFDYKLAIGAIEAGIHKIRINPSNMPKDGLKEIITLAKARQIPIRVGINRGSIKETHVSVDKLVSLTLDSAKEIEDLGYDNLILACKSSSVTETVAVYRELAKSTDYPLHIGLTEAGLVNLGEIKSSIAIGALLLDNIGDTIRVSLTGDPLNEVYVAKKILRAIGKDKNFVEVIACPTCSRTEIDVENIATQLEKLTENLTKPLKIAVMGCVVNGIGESSGADFGVCGGREKSVIISDGKILKTVKNKDILEEINKLIYKG